ncbi:hypothetical protein PFISCL1PPCAC_21018, partial [Pristionchus fissidentatus]
KPQRNHNDRMLQTAVRTPRLQSKDPSSHAFLHRRPPCSMRAVDGHCPRVHSPPPADSHDRHSSVRLRLLFCNLQRDLLHHCPIDGRVEGGPV